MKIAFIALALVFSAGAQADDSGQFGTGLPPKFTYGTDESDKQFLDVIRQKAREESEKEERAAIEKNERESTKPKCAAIRFTGVAAATYFSEYIDQVLASRDIEDTLARNPIQCHGRNMFGDLNCTGVAYFKNHKGRITDWNKKFYFIDSPVDFNSGRKNIGLAIRRQDAVCAN